MKEYIEREAVLAEAEYDENFALVVTARKIRNLPAADVVEVVRCGDCIHFMPKHILLDDGTRRPYTEEEKKLPLGVTGDVGINCGSRCLRERAWENNRVPVYVQETDFCSYGKRRAKNAVD